MITKDKWVVKNNSGTAFNLGLGSCRITFTPEGRVDLVERSNKDIDYLERVEDLQTALFHNNLITLEKFDHRNPDVSEVSEKLNSLIQIISSKVPEKKEDQSPSLTKEDIGEILGAHLSDLKDMISKQKPIVINQGSGQVGQENEEEERMREDAMKTLIEKDTSSSKSNLDDFGSKREIQIEDMEDFTDLIPD